MNLKPVATLACLVGMVAFPVTSLAVKHLSFGVYTSNKPTAMVKKFRPMLNALEEDLEKRLGEAVKIRIQVAKDYTKGIEHLATGKVDFSRFGPASYVEAKRSNPDIKILSLESSGGEKLFYGIICVAEDSDIQEVTQLSGKSFAFGHELSTIGRYLSQKYLMSHGVFSGDLSRFDYLDRHDKVGTAVGSKQFDAGALNEETFKKLIAKDVKIREIARFPNVEKPWIARSGLSDEIYQAIRASLLEMKDKRALASLKKDGFVAGDDEDFAAIRDAIENNSLFYNSGDMASEIAAEIETPDATGVDQQPEQTEDTQPAAMDTGSDDSAVPDSTVLDATISVGSQVEPELTGQVDDDRAGTPDITQVNRTDQAESQQQSVTITELPTRAVSNSATDFLSSATAD